MIESAPSVSVVLPAYNRARSVRRALDSVLQQTYGDLEVVVVDDGSTDGTSDAVAAARDTRVVLLRHADRRGASAARNTGCLAARGRLVAFQDSDDWWSRDKLGIQVRDIEDRARQTPVTFCGFWRVVGDSWTFVPKRDRGFVQGVRNFQSELLEGNFVTTQALLLPRAVLYDVGLFDEALPRFQDWDLALRLSARFPFSYIDRPLLTTFLSPDSITAGRESYYQAMDMIIEKHHRAFRGLPHALMVRYLDMAAHRFAERQPRAAAKLLDRALRAGGPRALPGLARMLARRKASAPR